MQHRYWLWTSFAVLAALIAAGGLAWGQMASMESGADRFEVAEMLGSAWFAAGLAIVFAWGMATVFNAVRGRRQMREGRGTWQRLWYVATVIALMQVTPLLAAAGLGLVDLSDAKYGEALGGAVVVHFLTYALAWGIMGPPLRWLGSSEPLPEVPDERFLSRYRVVCERMGLQPPVVRMLPSLSGSLETMAYVGGLAAPSVIVTDGIIHRLEEDEANAILAHELAHIANGSLWWYTAVWLMLGPVVAVLLAPWHGGTGAVLLALAIAYVTRTVVSRWFEIDCDLRGARTVGFGQMASGLEKVHKGLQFELAGWKSTLAMSMTSHPSYDVRIGSLALNAPSDDPVVVPWARNSRRVSLCLSTAVFLAWTAWLVSVVSQPRSTAVPQTPLFFLLATWSWSTMFLCFSYKKSAKQRAERQSVNGSKQFKQGFWQVKYPLMVIGAVVIAVVISEMNGLQDYSDFTIVSLLIAFLAGLALVTYLIHRLSGGSLNRQVLQALQLHRWDEALRLGAAHLKLVKKNPSLRHNIALAKWLSGQEHEALADLAAVESDSPQLKQTYLTRGAILLEFGRMAEAIEEAERLHAVDPLDFEAYLLAARAYFSRGDIDDAEQQLVEADKALPDQPTTAALRAAITARRGDLELAARLFDRAESLAPALPLVRLLAAEVTLEHGPVDEARRQITDAARLIHAAPLCLLQKQVQRLGERLELRGESRE